MSARIRESAWSEVKITTRERLAKHTAEHLRDLTRVEIQASGRVRTGAMMASVRSRRVASSGERTSYKVNSPLKYFTYQNEGFGPVVAHGRELTIKLPNGRTILRKRTTKPVKAGRFLQKAAARVFQAGWNP